MPFLNVRVIEGVFSSAQKQEMIRKLTDTMVSIEGEGMRPVTWVVIEEVKSGDWGIGGKPLTTSEVKASRSRAAKLRSAADSSEDCRPVRGLGNNFRERTQAMNRRAIVGRPGGA